MNKIYLGITLLTAITAPSCTKQDQVKVDGNIPPDYSGVPTIIVENYVNRLYIDLLGREATNVERNLFTDSLINNDLDTNTRKNLIKTLQYSTKYREGDSSYMHAWHERIYNLSKARFVDGADDGEFNRLVGNLSFGLKIARLEGDSVRVFQSLDAINNIRKVTLSKYRLRTGIIDYSAMCAAMLNNSIYDQINMNSFNFVNASYDDVLNRNPSGSELLEGIEIIDKNAPTKFFHSWASNKSEYCYVLTKANEFYEAQIRWMYYILLRRDAGTSEVADIYKTYRQSEQLQDVQLPICISDEYAQFR